MAAAIFNAIKTGSRTLGPLLKPGIAAIKPTISTAKALASATKAFARSPTAGNAALLAKQLHASKKAIKPTLAVLGTVGAKIALLKAMFDESKEEKYLRMIDNLSAATNPKPTVKKHSGGVQKRRRKR